MRAKKNLKPLGRVVRSTIGGQVVVAMEREKPVPLGSKVYFEREGRMREIGKVVDIIGNVKNPYAIVRLADKDLAEELEELYFEFWRPPRRRSGWKSSRR
ncbi:MAG: hypothetical protein N3D79_03720 [Acidilobaceae archaeon]|nr:hypothetical protein [Acidilobaceae archaeon]